MKTTIVNILDAANRDFQVFEDYSNWLLTTTEATQAEMNENSVCLPKLREAKNNCEIIMKLAPTLGFNLDQRYVGKDLQTDYRST